MSTRDMPAQIRILAAALTERGLDFAD